MMEINYLKKLGILIALCGLPVGHFLTGIFVWLTGGILFILLLILATLDLKFDFASQGERE